MSARYIQLLNRISEAGLTIRLEGDNLLLNGGSVSVPDDLISEIRQEKEGMINWLRETNAWWSDVRIPGAGVREFYLASSQQQQIYAYEQLNPGTTAYNLPVAYKLTGQADITGMEKAFRSLARHHESLRTVFCERDGILYQRFNTDIGNFFSVLEYEPGKSAGDVLRSFVRPFDLNRGPLFRVGLFSLGESEHVLVFDVHHIVFDGISQSLLFRDFITVYNNGELEALPARYVDYSEWQHTDAFLERVAGQRSYWLKERQHTSGPVDFGLGKNTDGTGKGISGIYTLDRKDTLLLKEQAAKHGTTVFSFLLAVYGVFLNRLSCQQRFCIGIPAAGRNNRDLEEVVGMFVNALPAGINISGEETFEWLLQQVKQQVVNALEHQDYPYEMLVQEAGLPVENGRSSLFNTWFFYNVDDFGTLQMGDVVLGQFDYQHTVAKWDLTLQCLEREGEIKCHLTYLDTVFTAADAAMASSLFGRLLYQLLHNPQLPLKELELLSEAEYNRVIKDYNNTDAPLEDNVTVVDLVQRMAGIFPQRIAVHSAGKEITYLQLAARMDVMAHLLAGYNISRNGIVAVLMERSLDTIAVITGILRAGYSYLPLNLNDPPERIAYILSNSGCSLLIADKSLATKAESFSGAILYTDAIDWLAAEKKGPGTDGPLPADRAYVIYTSGTTGTPKGVEIGHTSLLNYLSWAAKTYVKEDGCDFPVYTALCFDMVITSIFLPLITGNRLIVYEGNNSFLLDTILSENEVSVIKLTPSQLGGLVEHQALQEELDNMPDLKLKRIIVGGEQLETHLAQKAHLFFGGRTEIYNEYGPTEATVGCMIYQYTPGKDNRTIAVPIGRPVFNTQIYLLDRNGKPVATGFPGEICIAGSCLAIGYLNNPEGTRDKFVPHPFRQGQKMYRTGDMARMRPDITMEYIGRNDSQVKIRGFRVELGEVEAAALSYPGVTNAKVVLWADKNATGEIYAYLVADHELDIEQVGIHLATILPPYAIPAGIVQIDTIPLTVSGKADRAKLPRDSAVIYSEQPATSRELILAGIWKEVLNTARIGVNDDFYQQGGDSIRALRVIAKINREFKTKLTVQDMLKHPTIQKLAARLPETDPAQDPAVISEVMALFEQEKKEWLSGAADPSGVEDVFPASDVQVGMLFHTLREPASTFYHDHMVHQLYYENFDFETLRKSVSLLVSKHSTLRTSFSLVRDGYPLQVVYKEIPLPLAYYDYSLMDEEQQEKRINDFLQDDLKHPFDLFATPLWRLTIFRLSAHEVVMAWVVHHAIIDGWSDALFKAALHHTYLKLGNDPGYMPPAPAASYKDYVVAEMVNRKSNLYETYWKTQLKDFIPLNIYPSGKRQAPEHTRQRHRHEPPPGFMSTLSNMSKQHNISIKNLCFGAWLFGVYMLCREKDLLVGIIDNNRPVKEDGDKILGCFLNVLPVRFGFVDEETWEQYFHRVNEKLKEVLVHGKITFLDILKLIETERGGNNSGAFINATFNYVDFHALESVDYAVQQTKLYRKLEVSSYSVNNFEIDFTFSKTLGEPEMVLHYSSLLLTDEMAAKFCSYFESALTLLSDAPDKPACKKGILEADPSQYFITQQAVAHWQEPVADIFFTDRDYANAGKVAISSPGRSLTYQEFAEETDRMANFLISKGVGSEKVVGMIADRSVEMVLWIHAILKAGGAYMPINPGLSAKRIRLMTERSNIQLMICDATYSQQYTGPTPKIATHDLQYRQCAAIRPVVEYAPNSLAYIIHTSGSTGIPKGVMIERGALQNRLEWMQRAYPLYAADVMLLKTPVFFDVSAFELFSWYTADASLHILEEGKEKDPGNLLEVIVEKRVTVLYFVPSMLNGFLEWIKDTPEVRKLNDVRRVISTGEALSPDLAMKFDSLVCRYTGTRLINMYGPTETTIEAAWFDCVPAQYYDLIPIGRPVDNVQLWITDVNGQLQPVGVAGELCISGAGLARGYVNNEEETLRRFGPNHLLGLDRVYRTGDLARWLPDGNVECLGRVDRQLKIRGNRVEPGEIEHMMLAAPGISDACVVFREDILCGYYTSATAVEESFLRAYLSGELADYMVPGVLMRLDSFPLTGSGKKDVQALPSPLLFTDNLFRAPSGETEQQVAAVWAATLGREQIGATANFFSLGGDSIKAIQVMSRLRSQGYSVSMKDIFDHPTIEGLARQARRITGETAQEAVTGRAPLAPVQHRFFSYYGNSPHKGHYNQSVLLRCREQVDEDRLRTALQGLECHHDALRLVFGEDATGVYQEYQPCRGSFPRPLVYDLRGEADAQLLPIFNSLQQDCDPARGPLLRCALIRQNKGDRLLLVIHHLVVDGVSWRIIFEDLETLYNGGSLPARTASYGNWARSLQERRDIVDLEHAYWQRLDRMETTPLAGWRTPADRRLSAFHRQQHTLDTTLTAGLISEAHHAYGTETIELLLTGLILALQAQGGTSSQLLMLEGHGREEGISPLDISRTVGWFTSMFPVLLEVPLSADMGAAVKAVKEQWRHIPNRGAGYGIYRYCSVPAPLPASCTPEIMFNYMGQFSSAEVNSTFCLAEEPSGDPQSLHLEQPQSLHISVIAIGNKLELEFQYNCEAFTDDTITALITAYVACLQELTAHCLSQTQRSFTPSDFTYSAISNEALEVLSKKFS